MGHGSTGGVEVGRDAFCGNGEAEDGIPKVRRRKSVRSNKKTLSQTPKSNPPTLSIVLGINQS